MEEISQRLRQPEIGVGIPVRRPVLELHDEIEVARRLIERLPDGRSVYIRRPEDAGGPFSETLPAPTAGDRGPSYASRPVSGSAADVVARGVWADGWWTLEFARALRTGNPDDRDLHGLTEIPFALAVLDRAEDEAHASSPPVRLLLPATPAPAAEPPPPPGAAR